MLVRCPSSQPALNYWVGAHVQTRHLTPLVYGCPASAALGLPTDHHPSLPCLPHQNPVVFIPLLGQPQSPHIPHGTKFAASLIFYSLSFAVCMVSGQDLWWSIWPKAASFSVEVLLIPNICPLRPRGLSVVCAPGCKHMPPIRPQTVFYGHRAEGLKHFSFVGNASGNGCMRGYITALCILAKNYWLS